MNTLRLSCSVAALATAAVLAAYASNGAAAPRAKANTVVTQADQRATQVNPNVILQLTPLRKSITALTPAELASLRKGYAQMIAWNSAPHGSANFKRSLIYWANMHSYFGNGCAGAGGLGAAGMSGLSAQNPTTPDEHTTWCTCQHGTIQFLTWHRMYLYYFEKVLQTAAGNPSLRLPYWDYETDGHIPAAYRSPTYVLNGATVPNPLYIANRKSTLNAGTATLTAAVVSTAGAMPATSYSPFNSAIEQTPHGSVHCATGVGGCPTGYMGAVPAAGNDPIFYSHHANIDRLYECWLKVSPAQRLPSGATLTAHFSFIDGAGNLVNRQVADMKTVQQLGYNYTAGGGCPKILIAKPILLQDQPWKVIPLLGPTELPAGTTSVPVRLAPELRMVRRVGAAANATPARQATLVLEGVAADTPGVMVEVALQGANGRRIPIGVVNGFNDTAPHHDMAGMAPTDRKAFDATAALQALGGADNAQLVLEPTTGVTGGANLTTTPRAGIHVSAVRIELR
ncbi:MAG: tyrosinase family protein [Alphaproteobacteria bacterium]|nr:tyrosinase family protein [Alphaproteobacteria bacterium]